MNRSFAPVRLEVPDGAARHPAAADLVIEISYLSVRFAGGCVKLLGAKELATGCLLIAQEACSMIDSSLRQMKSQRASDLFLCCGKAPALRIETHQLATVTQTSRRRYIRRPLLLGRP